MKWIPGLLLTAISLLPIQAAAQPPTIQDFVKHPTYGTAKISPDGRYLAITVDRGDQDVLTVLRTDDLSPLKVHILPEGKSVGDFHWVAPSGCCSTRSARWAATPCPAPPASGTRSMPTAACRAR